MVMAIVGTLSQGVELDLNALNGEVFYAYEPNRVLSGQGRCYKVTVSGLIDQDVTSTLSTCNAEHFGTDYHVGLFAFNAGSKTQFFEGEYCLARGSNRVATLTVTSSSSASTVTAFVRETSVCALEVELTGPPRTTTTTTTFMSPTTTPRTILTSATSSSTPMRQEAEGPGATAATTKMTTTVTMMSMRQEADKHGGARRHNAACDSTCEFWIVLSTITCCLVLLICCGIYGKVASKGARVAPVLSAEVHGTYTNSEQEALPRLGPSLAEPAQIKSGRSP